MSCFVDLIWFDVGVGVGIGVGDDNWSQCGWWLGCCYDVLLGIVLRFQSRLIFFTSPHPSHHLIILVNLLSYQLPYPPPTTIIIDLKQNNIVNQLRTNTWIIKMKKSRRYIILKIFFVFIPKQMITHTYMLLHGYILSRCCRICRPLCPSSVVDRFWHVWKCGCVVVVVRKKMMMYLFPNLGVLRFQHTQQLTIVTTMQTSHCKFHANLLSKKKTGCHQNSSTFINSLNHQPHSTISHTRTTRRSFASNTNINTTSNDKVPFKQTIFDPLITASPQDLEKQLRVDLAATYRLASMPKFGNWVEACVSADSCNHISCALPSGYVEFVQSLTSPH